MDVSNREIVTCLKRTQARRRSYFCFKMQLLIFKISFTLSCRCLAPALQQCQDVLSCEKPRERDLTTVKIPTHMLFKHRSFYSAELKQALQSGGTVMIRSLSSYYRVCFSTESTHAADSKLKGGRTYLYNSRQKYHSLPFCLPARGDLGQTSLSSRRNQQCKS